VFKYSQLEDCDVVVLDQREKHWITELNTLHPNGYNLTDGGRTGINIIICVGNTSPLNPVGKRGGCTARSAETRAKMSANNTAALASAEARAKRAQQTTAQHTAGKVARFSGVSVDMANLDQYIFTKGVRVFARVGGCEASFVTKGSTKEENIKRAKEFLSKLTPIATLPNCSGNP
jgi:hypothetical protein